MQLCMRGRSLVAKSFIINHESVAESLRSLANSDCNRNLGNDILNQKQYINMYINNLYIIIHKSKNQIKCIN